MYIYIDIYTYIDVTICDCNNSGSVISCITILLIKIGNIHLYTYNKV